MHIRKYISINVCSSNRKGYDLDTLIHNLNFTIKHIPQTIQSFKRAKDLYRLRVVFILIIYKEKIDSEDKEKI